jgi:cyanophycinase-like exopeptidase
MSNAGPIALHGGGEYLPGDEPFLLACLLAARPAAIARGAAPAAPGNEQATDGSLAPGEATDGIPAELRVAIVPAAAAGERPDLAAAHGVAAFHRVAATAGIAVRVEPVMIVDRASAAAPGPAGRLAGMDLVHLPGGNPGRLLEILDGSAAWRSILSAHRRGAVVAGASAGAMVLADWTWTPGGWRRGLGLVPGLVVVPHAERVTRGGWAGTFGAAVPAEAEPIGRLGLDERTGVLLELLPDGGRAGRVVGPGAAHWSPGPAAPLRSMRHGAVLELER